MAQSIPVKTLWFSALLMTTTHATALQLVNLDSDSHKLVITEKDVTHEREVKPSEVLDNICMKGCTIKMADGEEYEFEGNEVVSIEEGLMFLDQPTDSVISGPGTETDAPADSSEEDAAKKE